MTAPGATTVELGFEPFAHQRHAHELRARHRFVVLAWHRRGGKTVWSVVELLLAALRATRERSRYGYVAPYLKQAKEVAWDYVRAFTKSIPGCAYNEAELSVTLPNGARLRLYGADNPDSLRGTYFDGVVVDEVADLRPQTWGEILRPALADRQGWAIFIGTPKGTNLFSQLFHDAQKGLEGWTADLRRASDTGVIPADEVESARRTMSGPQFAQEFDCDFGAAVANALVPLEAALAAQARTVAEHEFAFAPKVLGIDVARYGDDRSVIFPRQGVVAFSPKTYRGIDLMELAGQAAEFIARWKPDAVFIDQGGIGGGVVDRLRQLGHSVIGVDFGGKPLDERFRNRRAEMWWLLADWIKAGGCLPSGAELVTDLTAPTYTYADATGRLKLESKDEIRARGLPSPDLADALALTFAAPVAIRTQRDALREQAARAAPRTWDYDPLDGRT